MGNEKTSSRSGQEEVQSDRGGPPDSEKRHTESGAPTDEAHREVGDGTLTGSVPAGLGPEELARVAEDDANVEPGTG